jgi:NADH-quinone oxidoreductase subunit G
VAISEEFGLAPGTSSTGKLVSSLRRLGFQYVFDANFSADVTIMEEATEFVRRFTTGEGALPMFTSCCPGWINLVEKTYPELLPHLSTCKSPQAMLSTLVKTVWAKRMGYRPEKIKMVSIMPCVAKKDEAVRPQLQRTATLPDGEIVTFPDTDYVLTTRELGHLLQNEQVPFNSLEDSHYDNPLGESTGAAALFAATGGVMEAALRTAHYLVAGTDLTDVTLHQVRGLASGSAGIKEATIYIKDIPINVAVITGTKYIRSVVEDVLAGRSKHNLIEVMACPGGCVGGGGEPKTAALDKDVLRKRISGIWGIDGASKKRMSHHNESVKQLYETEFDNQPMGHKAHELLHTHYTDRTSEVKSR